MEAIRKPDSFAYNYRLIEEGEQPGIFEIWNPAKGKFVKPRKEDFETIDNSRPEFRTQLVVSSSFELAGLIKRQDELKRELEEIMRINSPSADEGQLFLANRKINDLAKDIYIEHEAKDKIYEAGLYVASLTYTEITQTLPELSQKDAPAIRIIRSMESSGMIGPLVRRNSIAVVQTLIAWRKKTLPMPGADLE